MGILLWPRGEAISPKTVLPEHTAEDLQLEALSGAMAFHHYYKLSVADLMKLWTTDPEVIRYRQAVLQDFLDHPELETLMEGLLDSIDTWESHSGRTSRSMDEKNQAIDLWDFSFLESYIQKVEDICKGLNTLNITSEGMMEFRQRMETLAASPRFVAVRDSFRQDCGGFALPTRVTVGFNLSDSLKPVSLKLMGIPEKGKKGQKMPLTPSAMMMSQQILGKAIAEAGRAISGYVRMESGEVRSVKQDIIFYLSTLKLRKSWLDRGLPCCIPEIRPAEEQAFSTEEMFSPLLVVHGSDKVVTNGITFREGGEMLILTGANQGGKTVFLLSVALTQWLCQLGIMVPCSSASISPVTQILTVFAPTVNASTANRGMGLLSEEAGRIAEAVRHMTKNTMVLFNEPLNATSPAENLHISREVIGAFKASGARGIWVTHLYDLASDRERVNQLIPWGSTLGSIRIVVETDETGTHSTYHIVRGEPEFKSYAAEVMKRKGV